MKIIRICETTVSSTVLRNPFIGICTISLGDFVIEKKQQQHMKSLYKSLIAKSMFEIASIYQYQNDIHHKR